MRVCVYVNQRNDERRERERRERKGKEVRMRLSVVSCCNIFFSIILLSVERMQGWKGVLGQCEAATHLNNEGTNS